MSIYKSSQKSFILEDYSSIGFDENGFFIGINYYPNGDKCLTLIQEDLPFITADYLEQCGFDHYDIEMIVEDAEMIFLSYINNGQTVHSIHEFKDYLCKYARENY